MNFSPRLQALQQVVQQHTNSKELISSVLTDKSIPPPLTELNPENLPVRQVGLDFINAMKGRANLLLSRNKASTVPSESICITVTTIGVSRGLDVAFTTLMRYVHTH